MRDCIIPNLIVQIHASRWIRLPWDILDSFPTVKIFISNNLEVIKLAANENESEKQINIIEIGL